MAFIHVDYDSFVSIVSRLDVPGKYKSQGLLLKAIAQEYNAKRAKGMKPLSVRHVQGRINDWEIKLKTIKGSVQRVVEVKESLLRDLVRELDEKGKFENRTLLYQAIADAYNGRKPKQYEAIDVEVAQRQVRTFGYDLVTPAVEPERKRRTTLAERLTNLSKNPEFQRNLEVMRERIIRNKATQYLPLVDQIEKGSVDARIKLHCLQCLAYVRSEVKHCTSVGCEFYDIRPYQRADLSAPEVIEEATDIPVPTEEPATT